MKRTLYFISALLFLITFFPSKNSKAGNIFFSQKINFSFFNSETGRSIIPEQFFIFDKNSNTIVRSIYKNDFNDGSGINIELEPGQYRFTVQETGYFSFSSSFNAGDNQNSQNRIFLDPLIKNPNFEFEKIQSKHKAGYTLIFGYVTDEITGKPLGGVEITSSLINKVTFSDNSGYYELYLPSISCNLNEYGTLKFKIRGFSEKSYEYLELFSNDDIILNAKLTAGNSHTKIDMREKRSRFSENVNRKNNCPDCNESKNNSSNILSEKNLFDAVVIPVNIRVGRNCTGTNCTTVEYYTLDTYCKYVLPAEIYGCWGALSGGANSLQSFSVAVRSYGLWYVYNPLSSNYDICDNTYCQVFGSSQNSYCNAAVDNTSRYILVNNSGSIMRTEYSSENNNKGCGNGYSGTGSTWPCIYDPVCLDATPNGHGRGLCQWGTVRWATGTKVSTSSPCSLGPVHGYGTKTWQGILSHYYPSYTLTQGGTAVINSVVPNPSSVKPCSTFVIQYNVTSTGSMSLMFAASIRKSGTTDWISDPAHDIKYSLTPGTNNYSRSFTVPCTTSTGMYDLFVALWYDKNNNNIIESSDLVVHSFPVINNAINVTYQIGINKISDEIPVKYELHQNYPNPFNPVTKIKFDIPPFNPPLTKGGRGGVSLKVFDLLGRELATLVNEVLNPGSYSVDWDASSYPSGVYFSRLIIDNGKSFTDAKKMLLIK